MKELQTEIEIFASPEKVWQTLVDLDNWGSWNPFIYRAVGKAKVGEKVDIAVKSGAKEMILHCTVTRVELNRELTWKYHVVHPALFAGEHSMQIITVDADHVHFIDREVFNGLLVPLQAKSIDTSSKRGFEAMDKALKARTEKK